MRPVTPLHQETSLSIAINTPTLQVNRIKLAMSFEPLQLTWLTSRELLSRHFGQLVHRQITSIEITERLLSCPEFLQSTRAAYVYCMKQPRHIYYGIFPLTCVERDDDLQLAFTARAQSLAIGMETYEVEIEICADQTSLHVSQEYARFVKVRFQEDFNELRNKLSSRETEVLAYLGNGYTVKKTASLLFLSTHTIETHKQNIYKKLGVSSMAEIGRMAERLGIR